MTEKEKVLSAIRYCVDKQCTLCPMKDDRTGECSGVKASAILEIIESQERELAYLRQKVKEDEEYHEWVKKHKIKGSLSGIISMSAHEVMEHTTSERLKKQGIIIRKLANNPILSDELRNELYAILTSFDALLLYRDDFLRKRAEADEAD